MAKDGKKGLVAEFKEFISRGNVMDMAVGIIIGSAFTKIVTSLVNDMIMPFVGWLIGGLNFTDYKLVLRAAVLDAAGEIVTPEAAISYGAFVQAVVDFLLVALVVFTMIKTINSFHRKKEEPAPEPAPEPEPSTEEKLLTEIRDLLKK